MEFLVIGADGQEYGPADTATLKAWVADGRIAPETQLKNFQTGQSLAAKMVPGLFFEPVAGTLPPPQQMAAVATAPKYMMSEDDGKGELWHSLIRSGVAVAVFFFLRGLGLIFGGYALYYAIQCQAKGNRYGIVAIVVAVIALGIIGVGWMMRLNGNNV